MQRLYNYLSKPNTSKVQAMQTVSRDFIDGKVKLNEINTPRSGNKPNIAKPDITQPDKSNPGSSRLDLSHPYYWAPFILIGNGL
jgi:CHAT domain-containing protein